MKPMSKWRWFTTWGIELEVPFEFLYTDSMKNKNILKNILAAIAAITITIALICLLTLYPIIWLFFLTSVLAFLIFTVIMALID